MFVRSLFRLGEQFSGNRFKRMSEMNNSNATPLPSRPAEASNKPKKSRVKGVAATLLRVVVHLGGLLPLVWLWLALSRGVLGGDPVEALNHYLGIGALRLLLLSLAVTPFVKLLRWGQLNRLRRPLGLWAFAYAFLHVLVWVWLELGLDWALVFSEAFKRGYALIGLLSFIILLALSITSLPALIRRLGKRWKPLHRLAYLAALLAIVHFWWALKNGWVEPALYLLVFLLEMVARQINLRI